MIELKPVYQPADKAGSKSNPYTYRSLISMLALKEETTPFKYHFLSKVLDHRDYNESLSSVKVILNGANYEVKGARTLKGGETTLIEIARGDQIASERKEVDIETDFDLIYIKQLKRQDDFNYNVTQSAEHKYSEGGGWYTIKKLCKLEGKYFIMY